MIRAALSILAGLVFIVAMAGLGISIGVGLGMGMDRVLPDHVLATVSKPLAR